MSEFTLKKYSNNYKNIWDDFVKNSINGTIFHEQKFISYHKNKFNDSSLLFYKNGKLITVFPAAIIEKNNKIILKSHPGTSYGGFVLNDTLALKDVFEIIKLLEQFCNDNNIEIIEFRHSPNIFRKLPIDQLDFALSFNNYSRIDEELSTCFPLEAYKSLEIEKMIDLFDNSGRSKAKKNISKAIKEGLLFRELVESEYENYYDILCSNLKKHNAQPVHSFKEINLLKKLYPKRIRLYGVFKERELAAGYLIFNINQLGNHIFYGSINYKFQEFRPTSYGLFMLMNTFANEGDQYLNMGISTEDGGKIINWNLFAFKESFNGTGINRYYWQKILK